MFSFIVVRTRIFEVLLVWIVFVVVLEACAYALDMWLEAIHARRPPEPPPQCLPSDEPPNIHTFAEDPRCASIAQDYLGLAANYSSRYDVLSRQLVVAQLNHDMGSLVSPDVADAFDLSLEIVLRACPFFSHWTRAMSLVCCGRVHYM